MVGNDDGSLRDLLGANKDPEFHLKLMDGWERHVPDQADRDAIDAELKQRFMAANRPDLHGMLRAQMDQAFTLMKQQSVIAYFSATGETASKAYIPGTMFATIRRTPNGESLDGYVTQAIREYGAKPLYGDKRFIRFERESTKQFEGGSIVMTSIVYVTPIPGSNRRRGLQLTASIARPVEMTAADPKFVAWKAAFDLCVSTLRWSPPAT
ncbi:protein TPRXL [Nocardioides sp.]|uniref:protein TPRXL n=1 Tax=Nocardioides sp. TaxID=35761 RepID=UPI0019C67290|nr:protein TPRXL [Nocardioides sp.]MBC7277340.1 protein TPRXL [Nocardioides sp.]